MSTLRHVEFLARKADGRFCGTSAFAGAHICKFVEDALRPLRYKTNGFSTVLVEGNGPVGPGLDGRFLTISVAFDLGAYESAPVAARQDQIMDATNRGFAVANSAGFPLPLTECRAALAKFAQGERVCRWKHKSTRIAAVSLTAVQECELSIDAFRLYLTLKRGSKEVWRDKVFQTVPDVLAYRRYLSDLQWQGDVLRLKGQDDGYTMFSMTRDELMAL